MSDQAIDRLETVLYRVSVAAMLGYLAVRFLWRDVDQARNLDALERVALVIVRGTDDGSERPGASDRPDTTAGTAAGPGAGEPGAPGGAAGDTGEPTAAGGSVET